MPFNFIKENARINQSCASLSIIPTDLRLIVSIQTQTMALLEHDIISQFFTISTSKNPPSCKADSYGTPTGLHAIADKIGAGAAEGTVFKGRVATGKLYEDFPPKEASDNLITSRILRLRGMEPGLNSGPGCDSYARYIYIHGTNHEARVGHPYSGGCVEMTNSDVIKLFSCVKEGDLVWIR